MKILQIVDVPYWAIGKLSASIRNYNPQFDWKVLYVHPKHVAEHLEEVRKEIEWADIIDFQYWNTAKQLMEMLPELKEKKCILTHHNEKDLLSGDWFMMKAIVAETRRSEQILKEKYENVKFIPLAVNMEEFKYNDRLPNNKVVGYAGRVVPWKGLREIAKACYELGYRLLFMGKFDKPDYWNSIPPEHQAIIDMGYLECPDDDRSRFYSELDVFVQNSSAGRETGTLPLMEAMACGVPVVTTPAGIAADICEDQENAVIVGFDDYENLKQSLKLLMENAELKEKIRRNAWQTIKNFTEEQRAWEYQKLYHEVYDPIHPLVSVIIPLTPDRFAQVAEIIKALEAQTYKHIEAVVIGDQGVIHGMKNTTSIPVKELSTKLIGGYNLAMARNIGVIEAQGKYLVFCDSRMKPKPDAIEKFVRALIENDDKKIWFFGNKGYIKNTFVENFSAVKRQDFINAGMMNERMDTYGGLSQEIRARFGSQGFKFELLNEAQAEQLSGSHMSIERRMQIIKSKLKLWKMHL